MPFWGGAAKNSVYQVYCSVLFYVYGYDVGYGIIFLNNVFIIGLVLNSLVILLFLKTHRFVWVWNFGLLILKMLFNLVCTLNLYPCCFCKLLGLFSCICMLLWFVPMPCWYLLFCLALLQLLSFLCPNRILFLDVYTSCIVYWLSDGHASDLHWAS